MFTLKSSALQAIRGSCPSMVNVPFFTTYLLFSGKEFEQVVRSIRTMCNTRYWGLPLLKTAKVVKMVSYVQN